MYHFRVIAAIHNTNSGSAHATLSLQLG